MEYKSRIVIGGKHLGYEEMKSLILNEFKLFKNKTQALKSLAKKHNTSLSMWKGFYRKYMLETPLDTKPEPKPNMEEAIKKALKLYARKDEAFKSLAWKYNTQESHWRDFYNENKKLFSDE